MAGSARRTTETAFMELTEIEEFEVLAEAFRIMTGHMAPGKDAAAASGAATYEERREAFDAWMETNEECAATIFMAIKRVTPKAERPR